MLTKKIDWYNHYMQKRELLFDKKTFENNMKIDEPYVLLLKKYLKPNVKILECGCGLARTVMSMAQHGFQIVAIDHNKKILEVAKQHATMLGLHTTITFMHMDFFNIDKIFEPSSFACITHQGVIEHYPKSKIKNILGLQLKIAPVLIFSVPLKTEFNERYFDDNLYRNLWTKEFWIVEVCKNLNILETYIVRQRSDNLLIVIKQSDKFL